MSYFLKILEKNAAGWLHVQAFQESDHAPRNVMSEDRGYFPVSSDQPWETSLTLQNNVDNFIICNMGLWRDPYQNNAPSRGGWEIKFQIVQINGNGDYEDKSITPVYEASAKDYYDDGQIMFIINSQRQHDDLYEDNLKRYKEWQRETSRV